MTGCCLPFMYTLYCITTYLLYNWNIYLSLFSQGKIVESIEYLENFIEVAKTSNLSQSLAETCICLGDIFNARVSTNCYHIYFSISLVVHLIVLLQHIDLQYSILTYCKPLSRSDQEISLLQVDRSTDCLSRFQTPSNAQIRVKGGLVSPIVT